MDITVAEVIYYGRAVGADIFSLVALALIIIGATHVCDIDTGRL